MKKVFDTTIMTCDYCLAEFDTDFLDWCVFYGKENNDCTLLCSQCAAEILKNQK